MTTKEIEEKSKKLNTLYKYIDFENLTINSNFKEDEISDEIKTNLQNLKEQLFGSFSPNKFKRVILPYYLQTNNIIQLFKIILNKHITEEEIKTNIIDIYNNNNYKIICKNGKEYMRFNDKKYDIPLNKINTTYEKLIKNELSKKSLLHYYNEKRYTITNITIDNNIYKFNFFSTPIEIPLINIYDNTQIKNIRPYNTNFNYEKINLLITNYYEEQDHKKNIYGKYQNNYSQYILLEKLIPYINTISFKTIEDIILIESIIDNQTIYNLWERYNNVNPNIIKEVDHFYICNKTKEIIYKESLRGIIPRRFFSLIVYISRLYNESSIMNEKLECFKYLYNEILKYFKNYNNKNDLIKLNNNIITSFDNWFNLIYKLTEDDIQLQYLDIINGNIISKLNSLDIVKKTRLQINNSKKIIMDQLNNNLISIKKITKDIISNPEQVINDSVSSIAKISNDVISNPEQAINDGMTSINDGMTSIRQSKIFNSQDTTTEKLGGFEFESNFLTETFIQNRLQRWVSGPKNDFGIYYPTIIQFVDDYINDEYDIDLISYKNKEKVCKEISELKNTIEENTKNIKYLLPKTFFDNEKFMEKYKEEVDNKVK